MLVIITSDGAIDGFNEPMEEAKSLNGQDNNKILLPESWFDILG